MLDATFCLLVVKVQRTTNEFAVTWLLGLLLLLLLMRLENDLSERSCESENWARNRSFFPWLFAMRCELTHHTPCASEKDDQPPFPPLSIPPFFITISQLRENRQW